MEEQGLLSVVHPLPHPQGPGDLGGGAAAFSRTPEILSLGEKGATEGIDL